MNIFRKCLLGLVLAAGAPLFCAAPALAEIRPSSDVVLPYFEVDLRGNPDFYRTTLFAICNDGDAPVDVRLTVRTNWGIPVLDVNLTLQADEVKTVNLRDWLETGRLPDRTLAAEELAHLRAALSGKASPRNHLFYATEVAPETAVGAISFQSQGGPVRPDVLWGDYFIVDPSIGFVQGETLVDVDPAVECLPTCDRHGIRFLTDGPFDGGTELMFWTDRVGAPSTTPEMADMQKVRAQAMVYDEAGHMMEQWDLKLMPLERVDIGALLPDQPFGWLDIVTDEDSFITGHFSASDRYSASIHAYCLPGEIQAAGPGIRVDKLTNGAAADLPPGPSIPVGGKVEWSYVVTNTGDTQLDGIEVTDSDGVTVSCPGDHLEPGESMTCTASGKAVACQHANTATVTGTPPSGGPVSDRDTSHYYGEEVGKLSLKAMINGNDANDPPGPELIEGADVGWTYEVTNTGEHTLTGVVVTDQHGSTVTCPASTLTPGQKMTCTASGKAIVGQHKLMAEATGNPNCGPKATATDPTHYFTQVPLPRIGIVKTTNGTDGPELLAGSDVTWTYVVTNTGNVKLTNVAVTDDKGVAVSCPKTVLETGESMTCTGTGKAMAGNYDNVGTATGKPPTGPNVSASDPSNYHGLSTGFQFEKLVNGAEADQPPGPSIAAGAPVTWTYVVVNTGDVALTKIKVTDNRGVTVTCPKTTLAPGESMTCTATGTAVAGEYCNIGTAILTPAGCAALEGSDQACYTGARIAIEKKVNGEEADTAPGPKIIKGGTVSWTYLVTNTGGTVLTSIGVIDSQGVAVTCPKTTLQPGESMTCTASGKAVTGQYCNVGDVTGKAPGNVEVSANDPACYFGISPDVQIEKLTNGMDADTPTGPKIPVGGAVQWTYVVTNTGDVKLTDVTVTDNRGVTVTCPKTVLNAGESMTCTASGTAVAGQYSNVGTVTAKAADSPDLTASDPSHYYGTVVGNQGCTPGYWKNHTDSWPPTGYSPNQAVLTMFSEAWRYPTQGHSTLLQALGFGGGQGVEGAAEILLRAAVAAVLNASHPGVAYPRVAGDVIADVNAALVSGNRDSMLTLAAALDADNNRGCPLN